MQKSNILKNKNLILTGAVGILGRALSQSYIENGANIALLDIDEEGLNNLKEKYANVKEKKILYYKLDLTNPEEVDNIVKKILAEFPVIDVLHNNAATKGNSLEQFFESYEDYKLSTWQKILDGNLTSMFLMSQAVGKIMKKQKKGSIIQTSSIYGVTNPDKKIYVGSEYNGLKISCPAVYSVSKHAVIGLTKYLASYWGEFNIRVNSISPGGIYSGQNNNFAKKYSKNVPLGRMATEKDISGSAIFLASDESQYITGQNIIIDGGLSL